MSTSELSSILLKHAGVSKHVQKSQMARLKKSNPKMYNKVVKATSNNSFLPMMKREIAARSIIWAFQRALLRQKSRAISHWYRTVNESLLQERIESLEMK